MSKPCRRLSAPELPVWLSFLSQRKEGGTGWLICRVNLVCQGLGLNFSPRFTEKGGGASECWSGWV